MKALIDIGEPAVGRLKAALQNPDSEVRRRARLCIEKILPARVPAGSSVDVANGPAEGLGFTVGEDAGDED